MPSDDLHPLAECEDAIALGEEGIISLTDEERQLLDDWAKTFSIDDAVAIKEFEKTTNHDVKAVEYWMKAKAKVVIISVGPDREQTISAL